MNNRPTNTTRIAVGCMSGTSLDGLDAVLVRAEGRGLGLHRVSVLDGLSVALGGRQSLSRLAGGAALTAEEIAMAASDLGLCHAEACRALCGRAGIARPDLVCAHGQTVWHRPPTGWQVLNPWPIARDLMCPVVFDLRGSDLAGGGQGAPLTPLADWVLFRDPARDRVVVNLGGFCNITVLKAGGPPESVRATDLCACNQVLDAAARAGIGRAFDPQGGHAARGSADPRATEELLERLRTQRDAGRSLGTGDEAAGWVARWSGRIGGDDLLASACLGVGGAIGAGVRHHAGPNAEVFVAGGSVRNATLVRTIGDAIGTAVRPTDDLGVAAEWREGACFAVLGLLLADGVEIALPGVTGRTRPIPFSGTWILPPQSLHGHRPIEGTF